MRTHLGATLLTTPPSWRTAAPCRLAARLPDQSVRWAETSRSSAGLAGRLRPSALAVGPNRPSERAGKSRIERYRTPELQRRHTVAGAALDASDPAVYRYARRADHPHQERAGGSRRSRRVRTPRDFSSASARAPEISQLMPSQPTRPRSAWTSRPRAAPTAEPVCATASASTNESGFRLYRRLGDARCFISCRRGRKRT